MFGEIIEYKSVTTQEKMIIEFLSDVIIYDEYGNNSGNSKALEELVKDKIVNFKYCKSYTKTITTGGFNAKWKLPKCQHTAFIKGTVLELSGCETKKTEPCIGYIGALNSEGYGQYIIRNARGCELIICKTDKKDSEDINIAEDSPTMKIIKDVEFDYLVEKYKTEAIKNANKADIQLLSNSCAMRLLSIYQANSESKNIKSALKDSVKKDFTSNEELMDFSNNVIENFEGVIIPDIFYLSEVKISEENKLFKEYIKAYIKQIKRRYQQNENEGKILS